MCMQALTRFWLLLLFGSFSVQLSAQINPEQPMPVDPKVKIGRLSNGLTYYIRQNKKPEQRVELRLVVNTGSSENVWCH